MLEPERFVLDLAFARNEEAVISLLDREGLWDNSACWLDYGGFENNYGPIGSQQSRPESALVEKLINSVDAVLMSECAIRGINPEGPRAPDSTREALKAFFKIYDGKLSNLDSGSRGKLAT